LHRILNDAFVFQKHKHSFFQSPPKEVIKYSLAYYVMQYLVNLI